MATATVAWQSLVSIRVLAAVEKHDCQSAFADQIAEFTVNLASKALAFHKKKNTHRSSPVDDSLC